VTQPNATRRGRKPKPRPPITVIVEPTSAEAESLLVKRLARFLFALAGEEERRPTHSPD
jgi:hypothetical protein